MADDRTRQRAAVDAALATARRNDAIVSPLGWLSEPLARIIQRAQKVESGREFRIQQRAQRVNLQRKQENLKRLIRSHERKLAEMRAEVAQLGRQIQALRR